VKYALPSTLVCAALLAACNQPVQQPQQNPDAPPGGYGQNPGGNPGPGGFGPNGQPGGAQPGAQGPGGQQGFPFPQGGIPMPGSNDGPGGRTNGDPPLSATPPRQQGRNQEVPGAHRDSRPPAQASAALRCYVAGYVAMELYSQSGATEAQLNRAVEVASAAEERLVMNVDKPGGYADFVAQEERIYMEFEQRYQQLGEQRFMQELEGILANCPR